MLNTENKLQEINQLLVNYPKTKAKLVTWVRNRMLETQVQMSNMAKSEGQEVDIPKIEDEMVERTLPVLFEQFYYLLLYFFDENEVYISIMPSNNSFDWKIVESKNINIGNEKSRFKAEAGAIIKSFELLETKNGLV